MPTLVRKGQKPNQSSSISQRPRNEQTKEQAINNAEQGTKWDINLKHIAQNAHALQRIHTLTSVLAGVIAGLFDAHLYSGIFVYVFFHLLMTLLIFIRVDSISNYFLKKKDLISGIGSGVPVFLCCWIIIYNVVYTL